jgi:hypothetical protein
MINTAIHSIGRPVLKSANGLFLASLLLGAMALPFLAPVQSVRGDGDNSARGSNPNALLGTWMVQVSVDPSTVPAHVPVEFMELDTFDAGGGFLASNNGPGAGDPAGQGNWIRTGDRQYALTQIRLGANGVINKIRSSLTLSKSGDEFTVAIQVDVFINGTVLLQARATGQGTRMAIEPLD